MQKFLKFYKYLELRELHSDGFGGFHSHVVDPKEAVSQQEAQEAAHIRDEGVRVIGHILGEHLVGP